MPERFIVVEAVKGRIVQSRIVEGDLASVVKEVAREALGKWDPEKADFVAVRDDREWELAGDEDKELLEVLERRGLIVEEEGRRVARIPYYLISYDNESFGEEYYEEKGLYVVTLYLSEEYRTLVEEDAADMTTSRRRNVEMN